MQGTRREALSWRNPRKCKKLGEEILAICLQTASSSGGCTVWQVIETNVTYARFRGKYVSLLRIKCKDEGSAKQTNENFTLIKNLSNPPPIPNKRQSYQKGEKAVSRWSYHGCSTSGDIPVNCGEKPGQTYLNSVTCENWWCWVWTGSRRLAGRLGVGETRNSMWMLVVSYSKYCTNPLFIAGLSPMSVLCQGRQDSN